ncbi:hypothetical protein V8E52_004317 [Russula decolorans]|jgi:hypothetical protein
MALITGMCFLYLVFCSLAYRCADFPTVSLFIHDFVILFVRDFVILFIRLRYSPHVSSFALTGGGDKSLFRQLAPDRRFILLGI